MRVLADVDAAANRGICLSLLKIHARGSNVYGIYRGLLVRVCFPVRSIQTPYLMRSGNAPRHSKRTCSTTLPEPSTMINDG